MKPIVRKMINEFELDEIDFMGYLFKNSNASFHHLIIPKKENGPTTIENGAVLNRNNSHPYLHLIGNFEPELFRLITKEMVEENRKGHLDIENLKEIRRILKEFEQMHKSETDPIRRILTKKHYTENRIKLYRK